MLALIVLVWFSDRVDGKTDDLLVYNQRIYKHLFETDNDDWGIYNKNSPPMRNDEMTRYNDGMVQFNNSIDMFVDWHCVPYENFLESKW